MPTLRTTLLLLLPSLTAEAADGLTFEKPKGWEQRDDPEKRFTQFVPPGIPAGQDCAVLVFPAQDFTGSVQEYLDQIVQNASAGNQVLGQVQPGVIGAFTTAFFTQRTPQGVSQVIALHAVRWGGSAQAVLFASTDAAFFNARAAEVKAMLTRSPCRALPLVPCRAPHCRPRARAPRSPVCSCRSLPAGRARTIPRAGSS